MTKDWDTLGSIFHRVTIWKIYVDTTIGHRTETDYNILTEADEDVNVNVFGVRPVVKFSNDVFTVKVTGAEIHWAR